MSDAFTDIARSNEIAETSSVLLRAEELFLIDTNHENLNQIYDLCNELSGKPRGYFIFDHEGLAGSIARSYKKRFDGKSKIDLSANDLSLTLNRLRFNLDDKVGFLSDMLTLGEKDWKPIRLFYFPCLNIVRFLNYVECLEKEKGKEISDLMIDFEKRFNANSEYMMNHLTLSHGKLLEGDLDGATLDRILAESGVKERFPVKYKV